MENRKSSLEVIFVIGMPRSSTSIVHRTLSTHPGIFSPTLTEILFSSGKVIELPLKMLFSNIPQSFFNRIYKPEIHYTGPNAPEAIDVALFKKFSRGVLSWVHKDALNNVGNPKFEKQDLLFLKSLIDSWKKQNPNKHVCVKYFHGILHLEALKEMFPTAKFILPLRDPEGLVSSSATLIQMVMDFRRKKLTQQYWRIIYHNIVLSYKVMAQIMDKNNENIHILHNHQLKSDFEGELRKIYEHLGLEPQTHKLEKYLRTYNYSKAMSELFDKNDFNGYFKALDNLQTRPKLN